MDAAGDVFIADYGGDRVRKVSAGGIISTVAGDGTFVSSGDGGPAANAQVAPSNVALDGAGEIFLFDVPNRSIRKISREGTISTVAIIGGNNDFVAADGLGNVFAACPYHTYDTVCEISPNGTMRTVAGNGTQGFSGDGGPATSAQLNYPNGIALDGAGNLYIADGQNHRIRKVTPGGIITTIAGSSATPGRGAFPAMVARPLMRNCRSPGPWWWMASATSILPIMATIEFARSRSTELSPRSPETARMATRAMAAWQRERRLTDRAPWPWTASATSTWPIRGITRFGFCGRSRPVDVETEPV